MADGQPLGPPLTTLHFTDPSNKTASGCETRGNTMIATTRSAKGLVVCGALAAGLLVGAIVGAGVTRASSLKSSDIHEKFIGSLIGQSFATAHDFFLDPDFNFKVVLAWLLPALLHPTRPLSFSLQCPPHPGRRG